MADVVTIWCAMIGIAVGVAVFIVDVVFIVVFIDTAVVLNVFIGVFEVCVAVLVVVVVVEIFAFCESPFATVDSVVANASWHLVDLLRSPPVVYPHI